MVAALMGARLGSGLSRPNSKRIMKSTQRLRSDVRALTIARKGSPVTPYCLKIVSTSATSRSLRGYRPRQIRAAPRTRSDPDRFLPRGSRLAP